jgi:hypothetical protein
MFGETIATTVDYTEVTLYAREIANGVMCLLAFLLTYLFVRIIIFENDEKGTRRLRPLADFRNKDIQAAVGFAVLIFGHAIRGVQQWLQYIWAHLGWDSSGIANDVPFFVVAISVVIAGKLIMIAVFAPRMWRIGIIGRVGFVCVVTSACILIPIIVAAVLGDIPNP